MERFFNNAGPSVPENHYMIDPLRWIDSVMIEKLIAQKQYFVLHAPRQTGKTSCLLALMDHLNQQGIYHALYASIEAAQALRHDTKAAMRTICHMIASSAEIYLNDNRLTQKANELLELDPSSALTKLLTYWTTINERPVVLFLDEVDLLVGEALISLLRQIHAGYAQRSTTFPISIILCGVRNIQDYPIHTEHQTTLTASAVYNISVATLRLRDFNEAETRELWEQHTHETGQTFDEAIYPELWMDTQGQPWLVSTLGYELTNNMAHLKDRALPITLEDYRAARETLLQARDTYSGRLHHKLSEPRVHRVISAILSGASSTEEIPTDDINYVETLKLIRKKPVLAIANRLYQESIPRELIYSAAIMMPFQQDRYLTAERRLDIPKMLRKFQQYFCEYSDNWIASCQYKEAGPQLLLQAFLQRIINEDGRVNREYGLGRKRTDLFIEWPVNEQAGYHGEVQRIVLELKIRYQALSETIKKGLVQTAAYADQCAATEAHLLIFDRRQNVPWEEKIWQIQKTQDKKNDSRLGIVSFTQPLLFL